MKRILNFFNACDEVWIPQKQVEETVRKYGYKGKLTVVENGNDFVSYIPGEVRDYKILAKKKLGFNEEDLYLLFVGQHIWEKGLDIILKTIENIPKNKGIRINFIGDGYARQQLEKIIKEKNLDRQVTFHGLIIDRKILSDYYAASDLFFFPSMYDNAPLVIREAAAMGTPSILLKNSTASEVITDRFNGFLVDPNIEEISRMIEKCSEEREILLQTGLNARNSLVRSWEDVVAEVMDRYEIAIKQYKR